ncbi:MAG: hypothetical protein ACRCY4_10575 [Brevinema sp.]
MRILTMITILSFCGNIFAQNSARESAMGHVDMALLSYASEAQTNDFTNITDSSDGDRAMALAALPLELANSIPSAEFTSSLKEPLMSSNKAIGKEIPFAQMMAAFPSDIARGMAGVVPKKKSVSYQLAGIEKEGNS